MLNCMGEGARVWFQRSSDPRRKLPGTWELVETPQGRLACVNTARANPLVEEALLNGHIAELAGFTTLKRGVAYRSDESRVGKEGVGKGRCRGSAKHYKKTE